MVGHQIQEGDSRDKLHVPWQTATVLHCTVQANGRADASSCSTPMMSWSEWHVQQLHSGGGLQHQRTQQSDLKCARLLRTQMHRKDGCPHEIHRVQHHTRMQSVQMRASQLTHCQLRVRLGCGDGQSWRHDLCRWFLLSTVGDVLLDHECRRDDLECDRCTGPRRSCHQDANHLHAMSSHVP